MSTSHSSLTWSSCKIDVTFLNRLRFSSVAWIKLAVWAREQKSASGSSELINTLMSSILVVYGLSTDDLQFSSVASISKTVLWSLHLFFLCFALLFGVFFKQFILVLSINNMSEWMWESPPFLHSSWKHVKILVFGSFPFPVRIHTFTFCCTLQWLLTFLPGYQ